jgi:hypothetical protein
MHRSFQDKMLGAFFGIAMGVFAIGCACGMEPAIFQPRFQHHDPASDHHRQDYLDCNLGAGQWQAADCVMVPSVRNRPG